MSMSQKDVIVKQYSEKEKTYKLLGKRIMELIKILLEQNKLNYHSIDYRIKQKDSLLKKIEKKQNKYSDISEITDVVGLRIISYYSDDVDLIAKIIESEFNVDKENTIDKRKTLDPHAFGYLSLHYVVQLNDNRLSLPEYKEFENIKVEIQIRTILQHTWAEIEHDLGYKSNISIPQSISRDFSRLAGLLELADKEFLNIRNKIIEYEETVKHDLQRQSMDIQIDIVSISAYIYNSNNLERLNKSIIATNKNFTGFYNKENLESTIKELNDAGFKFISDIDNAIINEFDLCTEIAKNILNRNYDEDEKERTISNVIGLFYLCFAKMVKQNSFDLLYDYLNKNNIIYEEEREDFAKELLSIYNEFKK